MKIATRPTGFQPITIIIETAEEATAMCNFIRDVGGTLSRGKVGDDLWGRLDQAFSNKFFTES